MEHTAGRASDIASTRLQALQNWLFTVPAGERSAWEIIKWWEMRRPAYNAVVLGIGFASFCGFPALLLSLGSLKDGEDVVEPMVLIAASFLMNFAYTAGPALELIVNASLKDGSKQPGRCSVAVHFMLYSMVAHSVTRLPRKVTLKTPENLL